MSLIDFFFWVAYFLAAYKCLFIGGILSTENKQLLRLILYTVSLLDLFYWLIVMVIFTGGFSFAWFLFCCLRNCDLNHIWESEVQRQGFFSCLTGMANTGRNSSRINPIYQVSYYSMFFYIWQWNTTLMVLYV